MIFPKKRVVHFVRKEAQLKSTFIKNQIVSHNTFEPLLIYRTQVSNVFEGGYSDFNGGSVKSLDLNQQQNLVEKLLFKGPKVLSSRQSKSIETFIQENQIEICHFHYGTDCGIYYPILKKIKIPSVVSFYGYDCTAFPKFFYGYGLTYLKNRVFDDVSAVLAMSQEMKKDLLKIGCPEDKIIVHYHGIDCSKFYFQRQYPEKEEVTLLILASLVEEKGHIFLFKSLLKLKESGIRNWKLRVVGTGELEETLKVFVRENDLSNEVEFVGPLKYGSQEMMREYQQADAFVHPCVVANDGGKDGIPGTIVEAMSAGLPVVATYIGGLPYILENEKSGLLVKDWDVEALAMAIRRVISEPYIREKLGRAGQDFALEHLDLKQREKNLENIYSQLIERHHVHK